MKNQPQWWDPYSCQPYKLADEDKPRTGIANLVEYTKVGASSLLGMPLIAAQYLLLKPSPSNRLADEFVGLSVMPDDDYNAAIVEMIDELGVSQLLIRIPAWDVPNLDSYIKFYGAFSKTKICSERSSE